MATRRRAELLLPSPLGLVTYDLLEDTVYLGRSKRGGLQAAPNPFPEAVAVLAETESGGFVVRALAGEDVPKVDGRPATDGQPLADGARLEIQDQVATFRHLGASPKGAPGTTRTPRGRTPTVPLHRPWWITGLGLVGALLVLASVALAVQILTDIKADENVRVQVPTPPAVRPPPAKPDDPAGEAFDAIVAWEEETPADADGAVQRWRNYLKRWAGNPHAARARSRLRERIDEAAVLAVQRADREISTLIPERRFVTALKRIREIERTYGTTSAAPAIEALRLKTREAARTELDKLLARVGPRVSTDPRGAHRELLRVGTEFPPDLAGEITDLMERAVQLIHSRGFKDDGGTRTPRNPRTQPPGAGPRAPLPPRGPTEGMLAEAAALEQWKNAHEALLEERYQDAFEGYSLLVMRYTKTTVYKDHRRSIKAGHYAARVGAQGPVAMLSVPAEVRGGRIEVEYTFDDARIIDRDFSIEQPFPSEQEVRTKLENGDVILEGTSALIHFCVWQPDVRLEANVEVSVAHDIGALAIADDDDYRAIVLSLGNTRFMLKKGADARANRGHVLWFMGQGVWADADKDVIGYIKIAERSTVKLQNGDRGTIELIRKGDKCEGSYHGHTDGVDLKGQVRGDDQGGMGPARIGLFANTGVLVVKSLRISGKVDEDWFRTRLQYLVQEDPGPDE